MIIKQKRNGVLEITFRTRAIPDAKKYNGIFVLVANKEKDTFETLAKFRKMEWIEDFHEDYKNGIVGKNTIYGMTIFLMGKTGSVCGIVLL